jgi:hypothetical protein
MVKSFASGRQIGFHVRTSHAMLSLALRLARSGILLPIVVYLAAAGTAYSAEWSAAVAHGPAAHEQSTRVTD